MATPKDTLYVKSDPIGRKPAPAPKKTSRAPLDFRTQQRDPGIGGLLQTLMGGFSDVGRGAMNFGSDVGDFLFSRPAGTSQFGSRLFGPDMPGSPSFNARQELIQKRNRQTADRQYIGSRPMGQGVDLFPPPGDMGPMGNGMSFADYLRQALDMLGNQGVNYDPQRNALRTNAAQANDIIASIYAGLQQRFADSGPAITARYGDAGQNIDLNTAQAKNAVDSSNTAIRDEQTRQLNALGIQDAIANVAPQQAADQANAVAAIERSGQIAGNANTNYGTAAATYNDENGKTAGMEGAGKQALLQMNLLSALANVDAREQEDNASLAANRQNSALSIAQLLMENDPEGAAAVAAQAQAAAAAAQQQFENQLAAMRFDQDERALQGKLSGGGQQSSGLGLQQVLNLIAQQQGGNLKDMDPKNLAALVNAYSRFA